MAKTGRNDPCICGSGKKYKHCCLANESKTDYVFAAYATSELLKVFALLAVLPQNHGKNIRIEQAVLEALRHANKNTDKPDFSKLRNDLLKYCIPHHFEDPPEEFFTELLYWPKSNNLVFPGIAANGVEIVQQLLNTLSTFSDFPKPFLKEVGLVLSFILAIHNRIAIRLGYKERQFEDEHYEPLFIPDNSFVEKYKNLFSFSADSIKRILVRFGISLEAFENFVFDFEKGNLHFEDRDNNPLFQRPFVFINNEYILVDPTAELFCLNDYILETAKKHSCHHVLLGAYQETGMIELYPVFSRMTWRQVEFNFPVDESFPKECLWTELLFKIDTGRLVYVAVSTEVPVLQKDLEKAIASFSKELQTRVEKIAALIKDKFTGHELLFIHVIHKTRILSMVGLRLGLLKNIDFHLFFSYEELYLLTRKWEPDVLTLWKYAKYLHEFESKQVFAPHNTHYAKMKWYFDHEESFYHSDRETPTLMVFEFEIESDVRRSAIKLLDKKALPYWKSGAINFVPCYRKQEHYPVYISQDINEGLLVSCLSKYSCVIWCISARKSDFKAEVYINGILYWLHEMFGYIEGWISQLGSTPVSLVLTLEKGLYEVEGALISNEVEDIQFRSRINPEARSIDLFIPSALRTQLYSAGNRGEWLLMNFVIDMIGDLQKVLNAGGRLSDEVKENIFATIMPNGPKKIINFLSDYRDLTLNPVDVYEARIVPKADISYVLQNQLTGLNKSNPIGKLIAKENQIKLLNELVFYHYQKTKAIVSDYNGVALLQFLMRRQESLLRDHAFRQVNYPVKQACYGNYYNVFEEFFETAKEQNIANLALRILIEWVVCWMPEGNRPPSNDDTDMLLAHVNEVLNYGTLSDELKYGLRDVQMEVLPSGRLGVDRSKDTDSFGAMGNKVFEAEYYGFGERFHEYYDSGNDKASHPEGKKYVKRIDDVFVAEWGISIHDVFTLTYQLVREIFSKGHSVIVMPKEQLVDLLIKLKYTTREIEGWMSILCFVKREDVLTAPDGFKKEEVYPWRYNRRISYLLKPIITIEINGEAHILVSMRHLYKAAENLVSLFNNGRLPLDKESKPIRSLLAERNAIKGKEYREQVLFWLTTNTNLFCYPQEITIKKKGFFITETDKGDIDILAIDHQRKIIYSIECKNTSQSKVAYEFHLEIIEYLGQDGKPGLIQKHVNRDIWLHENIEQVIEKLKLDPDYKIMSVVISNHVLPTAFFRTIPIKTISFYELKQSGLP